MSIQGIANRIERSPKLQKILYNADKNPALFNSVFVATTAIILKPATILGISDKKDDGKRDAIYASAKSVGTGLVDLTMAYALFKPMNKRLDKIGRELFDIKGSIYFKNPERCSAYKSVYNRCAKIALLPLFAFLKFALVQPIANKFKKAEVKK